MIDLIVNGAVVCQLVGPATFDPFQLQLIVECVDAIFRNGFE